MNKTELLTLTDEQVEQIVAAQQLPVRPPPPICPEFTTLACGEEGPVCSAC